MRDFVRPLCNNSEHLAGIFHSWIKGRGHWVRVSLSEHRAGTQFASGFHLKRGYGWRKKWRPTTRRGKQGPGPLSSSSSLQVLLALSSRPWSVGERCTHSARCPRPCPPHWAKTWEMQLWGWAMARAYWEEMWRMELSSLLKSASTSCSAAGASKRSWIDWKKGKTKVLQVCWR